MKNRLPDIIILCILFYVGFQIGSYLATKLFGPVGAEKQRIENAYLAGYRDGVDCIRYQLHGDTLHDDFVLDDLTQYWNETY